MTASSVPPPGPPLRIAVLGDCESVHTRRYVRFFADRGHEVHAISYYVPSHELQRVEVHVLAGPSSGSPNWSRDRDTSALGRLKDRAPVSLLRLIQAWRYQRAGLKRELDEIKPDVFHAHYVVEHGFYGSFANTHPFVVTAWGSDLLRDSYTTLGRLIARWTLSRADAVTGNDPSLLARARELGVPAEKTSLVRVGIERLFLGTKSVNLDEGSKAPPTLISDRALEPLYNIETLVRAFARLRGLVPEARLVIAGDGSQRELLEALVRDLGVEVAVRFTGRLTPEALRDELAAAHVYVSVPTTDSMAVSNLEAMAVGAFPVLSNAPSVDGWVTDGVNGMLVPPNPPASVLADALRAALSDPVRRAAAVEPNRAHVEAEGTNERNMLLLERLYYRLAGHPVSDDGVI